MERYYEIPNKLEARNFDELRVLMLTNNIRLGGKVIYQITPPQSAKGKWYAIFYDKMDTQSIMVEQLKLAKNK